MIYNKYLALNDQRAVFAETEEAAKALSGDDVVLMDMYKRKVWSPQRNAWIEMPAKTVKELENALFRLYDDYKLNAKRFMTFDPAKHEQSR